MQKKVYLVAGYNTISLGTGRKEFNPRKDRPGPEYYMQEAGRATLKKIGGGQNVDESVVGNFMASRFNNQAHLAAFIPSIDKHLRYKPAIRVEGACASGGLAMITGIKSILAGTADVVLALGVEVQNSVKAMYGADHLALAGYYKKRKNGHAYFFPGEFSDRAGSYARTYGEDYTRKGMAQWYANCIENARLCETAQEFENKNPDLLKVGMMPPNGRRFVDHLNYADCSKVSDGASAIAIVSEEGLKKVGIPASEAVELVGFSQLEENIMEDPVDLNELTTTKIAVQKAFKMAGIQKEQLATVETHDCFTITGLLATEAIGFAEKGKGAEFVARGNTARHGSIPFNTTGGLIGWGHPTGATGVHQTVTIWEQLSHQAGKAQIHIPREKPFGMTINMGGNDKTVVCMIFKKTG
ncbi:acetyl-CoA C-acetyltransferase/acetyl-CoA acyltransferase [Saccharicrinis carchari]|uniref:Acetyl-CoA C-acetyltransferase/acetyl-CoA acyltransferase n=2 Tax=Saccharicrinis carchari TaxID=1168039 RepID=A0A521BX03_SACCC|nr:acetyl-CoA C-acetyltransferase/acetyl-CoA acyltransferase [Saccharicrinis carchari]